jgi:hypothetical protein
MAQTSRIGIRTSVGGMYFDAVIKEEHTSELTKTEHPVEVGANISDHAFVMPKALMLEVAASECGTGSGAYAGSPIAVYQRLIELQEAIEPLHVTTALRSYDNMLVMSVVSPRDYTTVHAMRATILLEELILVDTQNVKIGARASSDPQKTSETSGGTRQPESGGSSSQQSILSQAADCLMG